MPGQRCCRTGSRRYESRAAACGRRCGRAGRATGPGRGRLRDAIRRPAGSGPGVAARGARVGAPGRPRRRLRPRQQPRPARRRSSTRSTWTSSCPAGSVTTRRSWRPWPPAAARVNLGTAALESPGWVRDAIASSTGIASRSASTCAARTLAARGWTRDGGELYDVLARLDAEGCARYVVTDVTATAP